ncbi:Tyrosine recombinase XerC, partial [termite gut metagenome]
LNPEKIGEDMKRLSLRLAERFTRLK